MKYQLSSVVLALSLSAAGHAMAEGAVAGAAASDYPGVAAVNGPGKTRAEVRAELARAIEDGSLVYTGENTAFAPQPSFTSGTSRASVKAEVAEAVRVGAIENPSTPY